MTPIGVWLHHFPVTLRTIIVCLRKIKDGHCPG